MRMQTSARSRPLKPKWEMHVVCHISVILCWSWALILTEVRGSELCLGPPQQNTTLKSDVKGDKSAAEQFNNTDEGAEKRKERFTDTPGNGNHSFMFSPVFLLWSGGVHAPKYLCVMNKQQWIGSEGEVQPHTMKEISKNEKCCH